MMPPCPYDVSNWHKRIGCSNVLKVADRSRSVNIDRLPVSAALRMSQ